MPPMLGRTFQIKGLETLRPALEKWGRQAAEAGGAALYQEAEGILTEAKRLTPVDTGTLRASGHVQLPVIGPLFVSVALGFGGAAKDYAVYVHENLLVHHEVGQAKFLEQPVLEWQRGAEQALAKRIRRVLTSRGLA